MRCDQCGLFSAADAGFCEHCGANLSAQPPRRRALIERIPVGLWIGLIVVGGGALVASAVLFVLRDDGGSSVATEDASASEPAADSTSTTEDPAADFEPTALPDEASSPEDLVELLGDGVFKVETSACGGVATGSAFAIGPHHLVTNGHVVAIGDNPDIIHRDGRRVAGRVTGYSTSPDLAVIEVDETMSTVFTWADTDELREGQEMIVLGYPVPDLEFSVVTGTLQGFRDSLGTRSVIKTDAPIDLGNSGGPVLTDRGAVAGVATAVDFNLDGIQFLPLAVTAAALEDRVETMINSPGAPDLGCHRIDEEYADLASARDRSGA